MRLWDFLFYAAFALVVVSFVRVAGVLLTFAYLIVPAVCGVTLAQRVVKTAGRGLGRGYSGEPARTVASYSLDLPTGAAIVCACGLLLIVVSIIASLRHQDVEPEVVFEPEVTPVRAVRAGSTGSH